MRTRPAAVRGVAVEPEKRVGHRPPSLEGGPSDRDKERSAGLNVAPIATTSATAAKEPTATRSSKWSRRTPASSGPSGVSCERDRRPRALHPPDEPVRRDLQAVPEHHRVGDRDRQPAGDRRRHEHVDAGEEHEQPAAHPRPRLEHDDRPRGQRPPRERRQQRADQEGDAEGGQQQPDRPAREPFAPADDDRAEHERRPDRSSTARSRPPSRAGTGCSRESAGPRSPTAARAPAPPGRACA